MIPIPDRGVETAVTVLLALAVVLGAVAGGGVAQTDSGNSDASTGDAEPNDAMANATPIAYGEEVNATLSSPDDVDYYAVNATAGDGLVPRLHLRDVFEGSAVAVDVVPPSGVVNREVTNDQIHGPLWRAGEATFMFMSEREAYTGDVMESNGTYYVRVREADNAETDDDATYEYNLSVTTRDLDRYDPNENASTATPFDLGSSIDANTTGYDHDVYAVNLTAGRNYTVTVNSSWYSLEKATYVFRNASPVTDGRYDHRAAIAEVGQGYVNAATGTFTAETNGTHYVVVTEAHINPSLLPVSNYTLSVTRSDAEGVPDDGSGSERTPDGTEDGAELPADGDCDGDGLTNAEERELGTDPRDADTDGDGLTDGNEG